MKSGGVHDHDSINIKLVGFSESLYATANRNNMLQRLEFERVANATHCWRPWCCCFGKHLNAPTSNQSCSCWMSGHLLSEDHSPVPDHHSHGDWGDGGRGQSLSVASRRGRSPRTPHSSCLTWPHTLNGGGSQKAFSSDRTTRFTLWVEKTQHPIKSVLSYSPFKQYKHLLPCVLHAGKDV